MKMPAMWQICSSSRLQMNVRPDMLDSGWTGDRDRIGREASYYAARYGRAV
jgi:hypothetical protein